MSNSQAQRAGTKKRAPAKGGPARKKQKSNHSKIVLFMAIAGILAAMGCYFLQNSGLISVKADESAESAVRLNEIMTDNLSTLVTESGEVPDWIEIINTGVKPVEIGKYSLLLNEEYNRMFIFPEYTLVPGEYLLVYAEGAQGSAHGDFSAPFRLSPSGGDTLYLMNERGKPVDAVEIPELTSDLSLRRQEDGSWTIGEASPGSDNRRASGMNTGVHAVPDVLTISEIMPGSTLYFPDETGACHDYLEIMNISAGPVRLEGWYLSDSSDKLRQWSFPDITLPAGECIVVHCSGNDRKDDPAHLHADFKIGSGETVYLTRPDGQTVSMVDIPALSADQAYSLCEGRWTADIAPTPGMPNNESAAARVHSDLFGSGAGGLRISEVMASPSDQPYDWIEIHNDSAGAIDLGGFGLSDRSDRPRKWQFPAGTVIQPGEYMGIFASGLDKASINGFANASFALSADGGYTIVLSDAAGNVLDGLFIPPQYAGISYGRASGQSGLFYFESGTPGAANNGPRYTGRADTAVPDREGGLFTAGNSFSVSLSAPAGSRIYYTLDGSSPTESSARYTGPIPVSSTTVLRTRVYAENRLPSFIDTQSYLFDVENEAGLYVISLVSDEANLVGETGILTNYLKQWEREAAFELFTPDGKRVLGQGCAISLHGQDSRKMPVKTFNVIARREYSGANRFSYPIFSDRDHTEYQSFLLRASGEDYNMSFMRDSVLSSLMEDTSVMYQECEPAIVYMNGQYYSLIYMRERTNAFAVCQHEGWEGREDAIDLVKGNDVVMQGSNASYKKLLEYIKSHDMTTREAYDYLDSCIDIRNFIEYMSIEIFTGNTDTLNVKRYRDPDGDGKWRWVLFDLDWAFYSDTDSIRRWLAPGGAGRGNATDNTLFIGCMKNPIFRDEFLTYFGGRMATAFSTENVISKMQAHYDIIKAALPRYMAQWDISSLDGGMRKVYSYAETRPTKLIKEYFPAAMKLPNEQMTAYFGEAVEKIKAYSAK